MEKDKNLTTFYLVRHGETKFNIKKILQGQTDSPLTETGRMMTQELSQDLANIRFDAIFSSDLARAKNTAEIIRLNRKLAINTHKLLRERSFGCWDGTSAKIFREKNKVLLDKMESLSEKEKINFRLYDGYETEAEIAARMITVLREIAVTYVGKTVLVVSHGAIMRSLLVHLGFGSYDELPRGKTVSNLGYIVLESDGVDFFIKNTIGINKLTQVAK